MKTYEIYYFLTNIPLCGSAFLLTGLLYYFRNFHQPWPSCNGLGAQVPVSGTFAREALAVSGTPVPWPRWKRKGRDNQSSPSSLGIFLPLIIAWVVQVPLLLECQKNSSSYQFRLWPRWKFTPDWSQSFHDPINSGPKWGPLNTPGLQWAATSISLWMGCPSELMPKSMITRRPSQTATNGSWLKTPHSWRLNPLPFRNAETYFTEFQGNF